MKKRIVFIAGVILLPIIAGSLWAWAKLPFSSVPYDFSIFYAAAKTVLSGGDPYNLAQIHHFDPAITPPGFTYPLWAAFIFIPLSIFPLSTAASIWLFLNMEMFLASIIQLFLLIRKEVKNPLWLLLFFCMGLLSPPVILLFREGQIDFLLLFGLITGLNLLEHMKPGWASTILIVCAVKPQIFLLPFLALLWIAWRKGQGKRFVQGSVVTLAGLVTIAFLFDHIWIQSWISTIHSGETATLSNGLTKVSQLMTIYNLTAIIPSPVSLTVIALIWVVCIYCIWKAAQLSSSNENDLGIFALTCLITSILSPWGWLYDGVIWIAPVMIICLQFKRSIWPIIVYFATPYLLQTFFILDQVSFPENQALFLLIPALLMIGLVVQWKFQSV